MKSVTLTKKTQLGSLSCPQAPGAGVAARAPSSPGSAHSPWGSLILDHGCRYKATHFQGGQTSGNTTCTSELRKSDTLLPALFGIPMVFQKHLLAVPRARPEPCGRTPEPKHPSARLSHLRALHVQALPPPRVLLSPYVQTD